MNLITVGWAVFFSFQASAHAQTPLYKMGHWNVLVQEGNVERIPQIKHRSHEVDTERSSPNEDPSPQLGYHFVLEKFLSQASVGQSRALSKLNPFAKKGALLGNLTKEADEDYYQHTFSDQDSIIPYLKSRQTRYRYGHFNLNDGPALVNSDYEFSGISDRAFGYCWGFSTFNRFFAYAAFFDPSIPSPVAYIPEGKERNEAWFRHYGPIVDDVLRGIPRVIAGFKNFSEFSAIPEIEFYLKVKAMDAWSLRAISAANLTTFFSSTRELDETELNSLIKSLQQKLRRGELPKILFTAADSKKQLGGSLDVHSVIVNGLKMNPDGSGEIAIWDINFYFSDLMKNRKFIEIRFNRETGKRELHYLPWYEAKETPIDTYRSTLLGKVRVSPEDEAEMGALIRNLKAFCQKDEYSQKYCGMKNQIFTE